MSDTPRTDEWAHVPCKECVRERQVVVPVDFARQLERELAIAQEREKALLVTAAEFNNTIVDLEKRLNNEWKCRMADCCEARLLNSDERDG